MKVFNHMTALHTSGELMQQDICVQYYRIYAANFVSHSRQGPWDFGFLFNWELLKLEM
jgi:hypothetical protein